MLDPTWEPLQSKAARIAFGLFVAWAILVLALKLLVLLQGMVAPLQGILVPLLIGLTIAYVLDPLADRLERFMPRTAAVGVIVLLVLGLAAVLLAFIIPLFIHQASELIATLPEYYDRFRDQIGPWARGWVQELEKAYPGTPEMVMEKARDFLQDLDWKEVLVPATTAAQTVVSKLGGLLTWAIGLLIVPVIAVYLLIDFDRLRLRVLNVVPPRWQGWVSERAVEVDRVLGSYVRGYAAVCTALAFMYSLGLAALRVPLWLVIGILAGLLQIIPYFGFTIGFAAALVLTVAEYGLEWWRLAAVVGVFAAAQFVESWFLTPKLVGGKVGLAPVVVLLAVILGGQIFGILGMFLAVPATAVIMVFARDGERRYKKSKFYRKGSGHENKEEKSRD